jgi:hypothetical protein
MIVGLNPFDWRSYGMYGFLADVRNYSAVPSIAEKRGFPEDASEGVKAEYDDGFDCHPASWLTVNELLIFNYDGMTESRRVTRLVAGGWMDGG